MSVRYWFAALLLLPIIASAQSVSSDAWRDATLYRDQWGTPHVFAQNPYALAAAFGYAQAQDHLDTMLLAYRMVQGRAAEVLGEEYADSDAFYLRMNYVGRAREALESAHPDTADLCEGFAEGVNGWMVEFPEQVPDWGDSVHASCVLGLLQAYLMSHVPIDLHSVATPAPATPSANAIAIAPAASSTGNALLAIQPHEDYDGLWRWYEAHLVCGDMNIYGATLFGLPVILQGHNESIGWALSPNQADVADVYRLRIPPHEQRWEDKAYYVRTDDGLEKRHIARLDHPLGPILYAEGDLLYACKMAGYNDFGAMHQLVEMARATDVDVFINALSMRQLPLFHIVYADTSGKLFYLYNASAPQRVIFGESDTLPPDMPRVSMRRRHLTGPEQQAISVHDWQPAEVPRQANLDRLDWRRPLPAEEPLCHWGPILPLEQLPHVFDPESDLLQACGTAPDQVAAGAPLKPETWPPWLANDATTYRAGEVVRQLGDRVIAPRELGTLLYDSHVPLAQRMVPVLLDAAAANPEAVGNSHPDMPTVLDMLERWDFDSLPERPQMTFFQVWGAAVQDRIKPELRYLSELLSRYDENPAFVEEVLFWSADEAVRALRNQYNAVAVPWGRVHTVTRGERVEPLPGTVAGQSIFPTSDNQFRDGGWPITYGPGISMVIEFGSTVEARSALAFGTSERRESPHFDDQLDLVIDRRYKPARFYGSDLQRYTEYALGQTITLAPVGALAQLTLSASQRLSARLVSAAEPPAPLPDGRAAYSVYFTAETNPTPSSLQIDIVASIPFSLWKGAEEPNLTLYGWEPTHGWQAVPAQQYYDNGGYVVARDDRPRTYAILGDADARITVEPEPETPAQPLSREQLAQRLLPERPIPPFLEDPESALAKYEPLKKTDTEDDEERAALEDGDKAAYESDSGRLAFREGQAQADSTPDAPDAPGPQTPEPASEDGARQTKPVTGTAMIIQPHGLEARLVLDAEQPVLAYAMTINEAPSPLPDGLAAFSPFVVVIHQPPEVEVAVALDVTIAEEACRDEGLDRLALYVFDLRQGWMPLPGQKLDPVTRQIQAIDVSPRIYAVLGPSDLQPR